MVGVGGGAWSGVECVVESVKRGGVCGARISWREGKCDGRVTVWYACGWGLDLCGRGEGEMSGSAWEIHRMATETKTCRVYSCKDHTEDH